MALVLALANTKGGVGKSTLGANIAVELFDRGKSVAFLDAEEGGTTGKAVSATEGRIEVRFESTLEEIDDAIQTLSETHDVVVVDTPGKTGDAVTTLCLLSDLILVPLQTSKRDLRQAKPVIRRIQTVRKAAGRPEACLVLNFTRKRDVAARIFRSQLEPLGLPIAETQIRRLDVYRDFDVVMRDAGLDTEGAAADIRRLIDEVVTPRLTTRMAANE